MKPTPLSRSASIEDNAALVVRKNPATAPHPVGHYSQLATIPAGSRLLVTAGQVGVDTHGALPSEPQAQLRNALSNVLAILQSEDVGVEALIKVNIWLACPIEREHFVEIWSDFAGTTPPPVTLAYVAGLARPEFLVEVEAWAAKAPRERADG